MSNTFLLFSIYANSHLFILYRITNIFFYIYVFSFFRLYNKIHFINAFYISSCIMESIDFQN